MNSNRIVQKDYHSHQIGETFFVALTGNAVVRVCPTVRITTVAAWSSSVWYGFRAIEISGTHDGIRFEFSCFSYIALLKLMAKRIKISKNICQQFKKHKVTNPVVIIMPP